ncbi:MAG: hypothetical protein II032_06250 [Treponema sp.]|nr:hypothetical protein [Treponema sp.]
MEQLSIYAENKKGTIKSILSILSKSQINVLGIINDDKGEFGTIRLILSDTDKAISLLEKSFICKKAQVLGIELQDNPGALEELLSQIEEMNININYMYVGYRRENSMPVIILHTDELEIVSKSLQKKGFKIH